MAAKIPRIRKLVFLQNFDVFAVQNKRGYKIEELGDMTQLRGRLCIVNLENVFSQKKILRMSAVCKRPKELR